MFTVYELRETLHDNCEERVERREKLRSRLWASLTPESFDLNADATRAALGWRL